jgi:hypothetical protein
MVVAIRQWQDQARLSARESSVSILMRLMDRECENAARLAQNRARFRAGDRTLTVHDVEGYLKLYWQLAQAEWLFFRAGFIPEELFAGWLLNYHESANEPKEYCYYVADGTAAASYSMAYFQTDAMQEIFVEHAECRSFFRDVAAVEPRRPQTTEERAQVAQKLKDLVHRYRQQYEPSKVWKLPN